MKGSSSPTTLLSSGSFSSLSPLGSIKCVIKDIFLIHCINSFTFIRQRRKISLVVTRGKCIAGCCECVLSITKAVVADTVSGVRKGIVFKSRIIWDVKSIITFRAVKISSDFIGFPLSFTFFVISASSNASNAFSPRLASKPSFTLLLLNWSEEPNASKALLSPLLAAWATPINSSLESKLFYHFVLFPIPLNLMLYQTQNYPQKVSKPSPE